MKGFPTTEGLIDDDDKEDDQTIIMLIPNKEASSGFNVGLPRYQWSPVLVLLFPLCVCVSTQYFSIHTGLCVYFSGPSILFNTFQVLQYCRTAHLPIFSFKIQQSDLPYWMECLCQWQIERLPNISFTLRDRWRYQNGLWPPPHFWKITLQFF